MNRNLIEQFRYFLKDSVRLTIDFSRTAQHRGIPPPPIEKPFPPEKKRVDLIKKNKWQTVGRVDLRSAMDKRRSHRIFTKEPLTLDELSFLLWATQGVRRQTDDGTAYRTVPSAGCRHALETYLCVLNVAELEQGIYRYLPLEYQLLFESAKDKLPEQIVNASLGQPLTGKASVT
ncbi:MAG: SagB/ThcOx family dehydrogenase, partial [Nitrospirota bacterium]